MDEVKLAWCGELLERLLPYLVSKLKRALLFIEARRLLEQHKREHKGFQKRKGMGVSYPSRLNEIYTELRELNKRGI